MFYELVFFKQEQYPHGLLFQSLFFGKECAASVQCCTAHMTILVSISNLDYK